MTDQPWIDERHAQYAWSFLEGPYADRAGFVNAFIEYAAENGDHPWISDFMLVHGSAMWITFLGLGDESGEYEEMEVLLRTDGNEPLFFLDFMYRLNRHVYPYLDGAAHVYYEGLSFDAMRDGVPVFRLHQGS